MLIDSISTINTVGSSGILSQDVSPSTSGVAIRPATGQIVKPTEEGIFPFPVNDGPGTISVRSLHTTKIKSSVMSPAATCESLDYHSYQLTCHRLRGTSELRL
jgi:hypothetical protein